MFKTSSWLSRVARRTLLALAFFLISSCGGGSNVAIAPGVGSGGTGLQAGSLTVGSISGFGSVIVNGTRYNIDGSTPQIEDTSALALGMSVQILGQLDATGLEGTASSLISAAEVRGKITNMDQVSLNLWVYNFPVQADIGTILAGVVDFTRFAVGDEVQIYGIPADGIFLATRIEKLVVPSPPILTGAVSRLDVSKTSFDLGGIKIIYKDAVRSGFGASSLVNGTVVRVRANSAPIDNVLQSTKLQRWISLPDLGTRSLSITGAVENFSSVSGLFTLSGVTVDITRTVIKSEVINELKNGSYIKVEGIYSANTLSAETVKIVKSEKTALMPSYSLSGTVQNYISVSDFSVQGQRVDASSASFSNGTALMLANTPPPKVKIQAARVVNGVMIADVVKF
jgi:Domain of unknown function (DUF5666)